ncbi:hypothetical protein [Williamsia sp. CHRR-6]|uniref:hypothetical protein n=1 Tax=Williamsia sp. CHRR-6 TaxID=2835871 RepID=UPI001BD9C130|nr:hypothetical protein [Williamsia sp. CHRR-6]MBT0566262.1 hypothetical protein [Williamsia sp. CHRR-6]
MKSPQGPTGSGRQAKMGGGKGTGAATVNPAAFERVVEEIRESFEKLADKIEESDDAFDKAIRVINAGGFGFGIIGGLLSGNLADNLRDKQKSVQKGIEELLEKLREVIVGSAAPLLYIRDSQSWHSVGSKVREARNADFENGDLSGYWEGSAADRYQSSRGKQGTAMETAEGICNAASDFLSTVGQRGLEAYMAIQSALLDLIADWAAAIAEILTVVESPWGAQDAINAIASGYKMINTTVQELINVAITEIISADALTNSVSQPYGFPGDKWPKAVTNQFSDATTKDGDGSGWKPAE